MQLNRNLCIVKVNFMKGALICLIISLSIVNAAYSQENYYYKVISKDQNVLFNAISGQYKCDAAMGYFEGKGYVNFDVAHYIDIGSKYQVNRFQFDIGIAVTNRIEYDKQIGVIKDVRIRTADFQNFVILADWENSYKGQGTESGQIQIHYKTNYSKHISYFTNGNGFGLSFTLELEDRKNLVIKELISQYLSSNDQYRKVQSEIIKKKADENRIIREKKITDSLLIVKQINEKYLKQVYEENLRVEMELRIAKAIIYDDSLRTSLQIGSHYSNGLVVRKNGDNHGLILSLILEPMRFMDVVEKSKIIGKKYDWRLPTLFEAKYLQELPLFKNKELISLIEKDYQGIDPDEVDYGKGKLVFWVKPLEKEYRAYSSYEDIYLT